MRKCMLLSVLILCLSAVLFSCHAGPTTPDVCQHVYDSGVVAEEPTCTTVGLKTYTCTLCSDSYNKVLNAIGHNYAVTKTQTKHGERCLNCGDVKLAEGAHTFGEPIENRAASCTEDGYVKQICKVCDYVFEQQTPALGHDTKGASLMSTEPTSGSCMPGMEYITCAVCKEKIVSQWIPSDTEHTFVVDTSKLPAVDHSTEHDGVCGLLTYTCTTCQTSFDFNVSHAYLFDNDCTCGLAYQPDALLPGTGISVDYTENNYLSIIGAFNVQNMTMNMQVYGVTGQQMYGQDSIVFGMDLSMTEAGLPEVGLELISKLSFWNNPKDPLKIDQNGTITCGENTVGQLIAGEFTNIVVSYKIETPRISADQYRVAVDVWINGRHVATTETTNPYSASSFRTNVNDLCIQWKIARTINDQADPARGLLIDNLFVANNLPAGFISGVVETEVHTCSAADPTSWLKDAEHHWQECGVCAETIQTSEHTFDGRLTCSVCEQPSAFYEEFLTKTHPWDSADIVMSVNDNSNNGELESGGQAYVSGEWSLSTIRVGQTVSSVDVSILEAVRQRNEDATRKTGVNVTYRYMKDYGWGQVLGQINTEAAADGTPDVYYNFVYDMVGASINGLFANVQDHAYLGTFYENYDPSVSDAGFNWAYMNDLTFSTKAMYLIASDYSMDLTRAYFVMPVNGKLLEQVTFVTGDRDGDGTIGTKQDFLTMVEQGEWTWSKIAAYTDAIKLPDSRLGGYSLVGSDCVIGFAVSVSSGLSSTPLLYTSDLAIVERQVDADTGDYVYSYPQTAPQSLLDVFSTLKSAVGDPGKGTSLNQASAGTGGIVHYTGSTFQAVDVFVQNRILVHSALFGELEQALYQNMWDTDYGDGAGFVVAPYVKVSDAQQTYRTTVHNLGKVFAVSSKSRHVDEALAFITYQTVHSGDILDDYIQWVLGQHEEISEKNYDVMRDMREQLVNSHDKIVEDAIGILYGFELVTDPTKEDGSQTTAALLRWHTYLVNIRYGADTNVSDVMTFYENSVQWKKEKLKLILEHVGAQMKDASAGDIVTHTCAPADAQSWQFDGTEHWQYCAVCLEKIHVDAHTPIRADMSAWQSDAGNHRQTCTVCQAVLVTEAHTYSDTLTYDDTAHWQACTVCGSVKEDTRVEHTLGEEQGSAVAPGTCIPGKVYQTCSVCFYEHIVSLGSTSLQHTFVVDTTGLQTVDHANEHSPASGVLRYTCTTCQTVYTVEAFAAVTFDEGCTCGLKYDMNHAIREDGDIVVGCTNGELSIQGPINSLHATTSLETRVFGNESPMQNKLKNNQYAVFGFSVKMPEAGFPESGVILSLKYNGSWLNTGLVFRNGAFTYNKTTLAIQADTYVNVVVSLDATTQGVLVYNVWLDGAWLGEQTVSSNSVTEQASFDLSTTYGGFTVSANTDQNMDAARGIIYDNFFWADEVPDGFVKATYTASEE